MRVLEIHSVCFSLSFSVAPIAFVERSALFPPTSYADTQRWIVCLA